MPIESLAEIFPEAVNVSAGRGVWLLHRSPNILLIPGTSSVEHLRENLSVAKLQLAPEIIAQLNSIGIAAT